MENKTLFDIYMKMDKEDLVRLLIDALYNKTIVPNQIVYPQICPPQLPDSIPHWPPTVWYTTSTHTTRLYPDGQKSNLN